MRTALIASGFLLGLVFMNGAPVRAELCPPPAPRESGAPVNDCDAVVQVVCTRDGARTVVTGFRARVHGRIGIVTALHGVLGCSNRTAFNVGRAYTDLQLESVDIAHDAAFLASSDLDTRETDGLEVAEATEGERLRVVGYPQGIAYQRSHPVRTSYEPKKRLYELLPGDAEEQLEVRGSPDVEGVVLSLDGALQVGYSGAPILTEDEGAVVAVANGGLQGGSVDIGWAMLYSDLRWSPAAENGQVLETLAQTSTVGLFGAQATITPIALNLLLADFGASTGRIYEVRDGELRPLFDWEGGSIGSVALGPNGEVYFSDYSDGYIYRVDHGEVEKVHFHSSDTHKVVVDEEGLVYFSEASGSTGDGAIFRLNPETGVVVKVFTVMRSEVDGTWDGDFAFASDGTLWLSSGNEVPASLYKIVDGVPQRLFTSGEPIAGLTFSDEGDLYYSDWGNRVYRIEMPGLVASEVVNETALKWASDVAIAPPGGLSLIATRTVPQVVGLTGADAAAAISAAGLVAAGKEAFDGDVPAGSVISQDPAPGAQLELGANVSYVVSLGPDIRVMPDLIGLSLGEADQAAYDAGIARLDTVSPVDLSSWEQATMMVGLEDFFTANPSLLGAGYLRCVTSEQRWIVEDVLSRFGVDFEDSSLLPEIAEGYVCHQAPAPGEPLPPDLTVSIVLVGWWG